MTTRATVVTGVGLAVTGLQTAADLLSTDPVEPGAGPAPDLTGRHLRHKDRASRLALRAVEQALADASLATDSTDRADTTTATVVSSNFGNLDSVCEFTDRIADQSSAALSPLGLPHVSSNAIAGWIAIRHGLRGPNLTLCSGRTSGLDALLWAATLIGAGRADAAVVVGVEPDTGPVRSLFGPGRRVLDGAAAVVLESEAHAANRQAIVRALVGGGYHSDGVDQVVAAIRTAARPPRLWLTAADVSPEFGSPIRILDLTRRLGECSGALGVLQCVVAVAQFDGGDRNPVYATCGDQHGGEVMTLHLRAPRAAASVPVGRSVGNREFDLEQR
ncbi:beta-ketoacyl synthase N-terminal-like domain-containing protein [Nocardia sp. CA-084685]|uniref:beta-ketoacyl synthase N-terminal-like domain-containing protein n=1 Tax=Nocardia sp. CA-084685 TaxID=3239970 RepID=UPI003D97FBB1